MSCEDVTALAPLLLVSSVVTVELLLASFVRRRSKMGLRVAMSGVSLAFLSTLASSSIPPRRIGSLIIADAYSRFWIGLFSLAALAVLMLSESYFERRDEAKGEVHMLALLALAGAFVLAMSAHFAAAFLGLELLSVSLYALIAYPASPDLAKSSRGTEAQSPSLAAKSREAGLKYLLLSGASSAFLLFGMALVYFEAGSGDFERMGVWSTGLGGGVFERGLFVPGVAVMWVGIGFKLGVFPFHMWTGDVYEGAPTPIASFIATVSKAAVLAMFLRYGLASHLSVDRAIAIALSGIAIGSMLVGNLLALLQTNLKRMLAYSSVAHVGYILVALSSWNDFGVEAVGYSAAGYFATTLVAFGVLSHLATRRHDHDSIEDFRGLFWRRPQIAAAFTLALLSLGGIPFTAGFSAKLFVLASGVDASHFALAAVVVASSAIGIFYYLRVVVVMMRTGNGVDFAPGSDEAVSNDSSARSEWVVLGALIAVVIWLGVYPNHLVRWLDPVVTSLAKR